MPRREFLRNSLVLAAPLVIGGVSMPAFALTTPPTRARGSTIRNVKNYGAVGNGSHDDTAGIQAAINSLPSTGGTVTIPAGTYMIDTSKKINLRSRMRLQLAAGAILKAKTSSLSRHYLIHINGDSDVEISGGQLVGDRDTHRYGSGTHEWGHGISIGGGATRVTDPRSARVQVHRRWRLHRRRRERRGHREHRLDQQPSPGPVDHQVLEHQGLRLGVQLLQGHLAGVRHRHRTGRGRFAARSILIQNCRLNNNAKYGFNIWKRTSGVTDHRVHAGAQRQPGHGHQRRSSR